jgi:hypothetical protein
MRVTTPFDASSRTASKSAARSTRRCEKPSGSSALSQERRDVNPDDREFPLPMQIELLYQEETPRFDPFWDGPRLMPTFVAQLMGQILLERRDSNVSVETAYGSAHPRKALVLDRKS